MNSTRNWQKNAEITKFSNFWAICVRKRIFLEFSKFPLFGPRFPLFSRCSGPIPAVFPLFSRYFPAVLRALWFLQGFAVKTHKISKISKILSKTVVLRPKRTKKQNFQKFCPKQWFCGPNAQKKTEFSEFHPNQVKTDKKNQFFRNLAQNRSKRTKRQNFQKSCFEKVKTHQKTHFSDFVCKTVRLQSKHTNKTKFSEILARTAVCGQNVQNKQNFRN